ncbi:MAG: 4-alpha-glucanotransferase [Pirellulales bacterium]
MYCQPLMTPDLAQLEQLAELYGVQTSYEDVRHQRQHASREALLAVLGDLGAGVQRMGDLPAALARRRHTLAAEGVEPVLVAWNGEAGEFTLTLPRVRRAKAAECVLRSDDGETASWTGELRDGVSATLADGVGVEEQFVTYRLRTPPRIPVGYHQLTVDVGWRQFQSVLIAAPTCVYVPSGDCGHGGASGGASGERVWGAFLPLYAVRSDRNWGAGDFTDLAELSAWLRGQGGRLVGTLPLLAAYLNEPFEPSPYAPASRQFWNEFYIDVESVAEVEHCAAARELLAAALTRQAIDELRATDLVDYRRLMALKRQVLELLAADFHARRPPRFAEFARFVAEHPRLDDYAAFRATYERRGEAWQAWPTPLCDGTLSSGDYDESAANYHRYVQWIASEQLERLAQQAAAAGDGLYLDLPLGVRQDGYDVWRNRGDFAAAASAGAPPDAVFTRGQDWGFAPLHPEGVRRSGYRHVRDYLAHHMRFARTLRIDHVMGLHRLYWIPHGMSAANGVYVRYRADELYAVLSVESHRNRTAIIGENLGTVPKEVNIELDRHGVRRMYVVQYEYESEAIDGAAIDGAASSAVGEGIRLLQSPLKSVPAASIGTINTHDMPPFAAWWSGDDVPDRVAMGLMTDEEARQEMVSRGSCRRRIVDWLAREGWLAATNDGEAATGAVLHAIVKFLAGSPAESVLVNLEDLWLEKQPQNTPGTSVERPNWRHKAARSLEQLREQNEIRELFSEIDRLRAARSNAVGQAPAVATSAKG